MAGNASVDFQTHHAAVTKYDGSPAALEVRLHYLNLSRPELLGVGARTLRRQNHRAIAGADYATGSGSDRDHRMEDQGPPLRAPVDEVIRMADVTTPADIRLNRWKLRRLLLLVSAVHALVPVRYSCSAQYEVFEESPFRATGWLVAWPSVPAAAVRYLPAALQSG